MTSSGEKSRTSTVNWYESPRALIFPAPPKSTSNVREMIANHNVFIYKPLFFFGGWFSFKWLDVYDKWKGGSSLFCTVCKCSAWRDWIASRKKLDHTRANQKQRKIFAFGVHFKVFFFWINTFTANIFFCFLLRTGSVCVLRGIKTKKGTKKG